MGLILVQNKGFGPREGHSSHSILFETLAKDEKVSIVTSELIHHEIRSKTLSLAGFNSKTHYYLLDVVSQHQMSRMRNFEADLWRLKAMKRADAYVYHVEIENLDSYLSHTRNNFFDRSGWSHVPGWELDRYAIRYGSSAVTLLFLLQKVSPMMCSPRHSRLLQTPHLVENPEKPLVLLVNNHDDGKSNEEFDIGRLVNLFGLEGLTRRPFRALPYSDGDDVKEALNWIGAKARYPTDEDATTTTAGETEDESFIATSNTGFPSDADGYVLDYEPTLSGGNATLQRFEPVKKGTPCPFARAAKLWGGKLADETVPVLADRSTIEDVATNEIFWTSRLTHDTPAFATKWDNPITMRDKARVAFKNASCPYHIPEELPYPVAEHVVKPMVDDGKNVVKWWDPIKQNNGEESSMEE